MVKNMEKIVEKALKIDLHIHSIYSSKKDGAKVKRNTEDNIQVLVQKLNDNGVELCSVTDHDEFSYSMYESLKKYEKKESSLKKVLPGIEFSVRFIDDKVYTCYCNF
jgi:predicted metal-dependent phosphoesterase TrpH